MFTDSLEQVLKEELELKDELASSSISDEEFHRRAYLLALRKDALATLPGEKWMRAIHQLSAAYLGLEVE